LRWARFPDSDGSLAEGTSNGGSALQQHAIFSGDVVSESELSARGVGSVAFECKRRWPGEGGGGWWWWLLIAFAIVSPSMLPKDMQSPRFRAIMRATSGRRRRPRVDVKSFSHELGQKMPQHYQFIRNHRLEEDIVAIMKVKFNHLKEEVDCELAIFAGDLVGLLEKTADEHPEWRVLIEDMLVVTRECAAMSPDEFWRRCESIVQSLDDRRQELPMGTLKQAHTRMLFILTRCTRLLQFQKEGGNLEVDHVLGLHQLSDLGVYPSQGSLGVLSHTVKNLISTKDMMMKEKLSSPSSYSPGSRNRISSWKKLPSAAEKNVKKDQEVIKDDDMTSKDGACSVVVLPIKTKKADQEGKAGKKAGAGPPLVSKASSASSPSQLDSSSSVLQAEQQQAHLHADSAMICRICDLKIPKVHVEDHSRICAIASKCDMKGLTVNVRLERVADVLEKIMECWSPKSLNAAVAVHEVAIFSTSIEEHQPQQHLSRGLDGLSRPSETAAMDPSSSPDDQVNVSCSVGEMSILTAVLCKTDASITSDPSPGSLTPPSPSSTPRDSHMELLWTGRSTFSDLENFQQIHDLVDIAYSVATTNSNDYSSLDYLHSCLDDLQEIIKDKKVDALVVETFGRRIEKLLREKYASILQQIDDGNTDPTSVTTDEDDCAEMDSAHCSRPMCSKIKDRTTIEDFEIIKPISRGAFGRVFLAKKRVTGDLFAIKVLKKADTIRKNAVESILAERNILISVRNPFVVRFFYSFTCRENLYLVMEYLNGGDLYSLLRNLGCLDEDMTRMYIAEVVLALEYLHSMNVVHRDLKPDNLLIAHDGHVKMTDFGLSKVGLINSTDDLSGPDLSNSSLLGDQSPEARAERMLKREQRRKQSVVGTPDYLAPEILLGMTHGPTADWWSVGIILYELLVGIPPFNAEHPQKIFDNIMNRNITWPLVPDEMSYEAYDLIDKLLIENPLQRLGATGAGEVKRHPFFKSINWEMLAKQKAAFIPSTEGEDDTSYFTCRHTWNSMSIHARPSQNDYDDMTDTCSMSCGSSSPSSYDPDEEVRQILMLAFYTT
ncbi:hypothetical protein Taro_003095, partial [Colocasia esculenta]|nr:hypothetical protein [Colocasia esculenta]